MRFPALAVALLLTLFVLALPGCGGSAGGEELVVWFHAGQEAERATMQAQVAAFEKRHPEIDVRLELIPENSYPQQVRSAAAAGELPDLLEIDGPYVASYAAQGSLRPLRGLLDDATLEGLLPSLRSQGSWDGKLWAVGTFDSGLGIWARPSMLGEVGARIPSGYEDAWKGHEFSALLEKLAKVDEDGRVLDLGLHQGNEWLSFAFLPLIASAGGQVIDPERNKSIGALAGSGAELAMTVVQSWFQQERVDPNLDGQAFLQGRVALAWGGHWQYARMREQLGQDLVLLPLPDFGRGAKTGQGSWCWSVPKGSRHPEAAAKFLAFLLEKEQILAMCAANGAIPATREAVAASPRHAEGGPLALFVEGLERHAVPRPRTPAYPVVTSAFQEAFRNVRDGRPVAVALSRAATAIDRELASRAEDAERKD